MRLKLTMIFVLAAVFCAISPVFSQDAHMSLGIKASFPFGYGFEASVPVTRLGALRLGLSTTSGVKFGEYKTAITELSDEDDYYYIARFNSVPDFIAKPELNFTHGNLLFDFYPGGKAFHLTAGVFMGTFTARMTGRLVDSNNNTVRLNEGYTWPVVDVGDQQIELSSGKANLDVQLGNHLKPYFGLGFGRAVPKKRVSFMFEIGALYQGNNYRINCNGSVIDLSSSSQQELLDLHDDIKTALDYARFLPMINFQLSFRIF